MQEPKPDSHGPFILIDESLADKALATALKAVDYNAAATTEQFKGAPDPTIIGWLSLQGGIWVTADEEAKRKHSQVIRESNISIIWIRRPKTGGFPKRTQLLLLLSVLEPILEEISRHKNRCHFLAKFSGQRPKWEVYV